MVIVGFRYGVVEVYDCFSRGEGRGSYVGRDGGGELKGN